MDLDKLINGRPSVPVKVFSQDGSEFLGTELLLHEDIYAGQQLAGIALQAVGRLPRRDRVTFGLWAAFARADILAGR